MSGQIDPVIFQLIADSSPFKDGFDKAAAAAAADGRQIETSIASMNAAMASSAVYQKQLLDGFDAQSAAAKAYADTFRAAATATTSAASGVASGVAQSMSGAGAAVTGFGNVSGGVAREIGVLFGEGLRGNFTRMEGSLVTLGNRMGVLSSLISPIGLAFAAVATALGVTVLHMIEAEENTVALNGALVATNGYAGQTTQALVDLVGQVQATGASAKDAQADVLELAKSGQFAGEMLNEAALGAAAFADLTGQKIDVAVKEFEKLAGNPLSATIALNDKMHLLDATQIQLIADAEASGNKFLAQALAIQAVASAAEQADAKQKQFAQDNGFWASFTRDLGSAEEAEAGVADTMAVVAAKTAIAAAEQQKLAAAQQIVASAGTSFVSGQIAAFEKETISLTALTGKYGETKVAMVDYQVEQAKAQLQSTLMAAAINQLSTLIAQGVNPIKAYVQAWSSFDVALQLGVTNIDSAAAKTFVAAEAADKHAAAIKAAKEQQTLQNEALAKFEEIEQKVLNSLDQEASDTPKVTAAKKALADAQQQLTDLQAGWNSGLLKSQVSQTDYNVVLAASQRLVDVLNTKLQTQIDIQTALNALNVQAGTQLDQLKAKWDSDTAAIGANKGAVELNTEYQKDLKEAIDADAESIREHGVAAGQDIEVLKAWAMQQAQTTLAIKANEKVIQEWQGIVSSGLNSFGTTIAQTLTGGIKSFKDFEKSVLGDFTQFIAAMIEEMLKLTVFNGIINNMFGLSGSSALPTGSFGGIGGGIVSLFTGGGTGGLAGSAGGAAGGGGAIDSAISNMSTTNGVMGWLFGPTTAENLIPSGLGTIGSADELGLLPGYEGQAVGTYGGELGSSVNGGSGVFGQIAPYLGLLAAGASAIGEYGAAGGGVAGIAGGLTYGIGTLALGGAATGLIGAGLGGGLAGLGAGAAAGEAGALGAGSAGAFAGSAAIPIIGWVAAAAMILNMVTGGGLFGTSANKFVNGEQDETIGANGASVDTTATFKGKKPLFGGSYYKTKDEATDPAAITAANSFQTTLQTMTTAFATALGTTAPTLIGGTLKSIFDKTGKVTSSTDTVMGVTTTETQAQFGERLEADNLIAVMDKLGLGATALTKSLQSNADALIAAAQDMAQTATAANANITAGFKFMALTSTQTLPQVMKFVEGLQQSGETLSAAYNRLAAAQQSYNSFVGQFAKAATYVDPFEQSLSNVQAQMQANVAQANALAIAAGASGASVQDLANIQSTAAAQVAALVVQLQDSSQQLAFSLGLSNQGSADQISSALDALTTAGTKSASSVLSFGSAMQKVSQQATDAMTLLLGNLSPLNDQQKLQAALAGLRAGTATKDEVLTIGRNLYASSQQYTDLYNQVAAIPTRGGGATGHGGGGGSSSSSSFDINNLSPADQAKYKALLAEQTSMQAANTAAQYQTLAQQIEEIANAKGETFQQVISEEGIDIKGLEKGLSITSDADFAAYMAKLGAQQDSAGTNTTSIVSAINNMGQNIVAAINGSQNGTNGTPITRGTPSGATSSSTGTRSAPPATTGDIAQAVTIGIQRGIQQIGGRFNR